VERNNATDRRQNGRKQRKTYGSSRDKRMHDAATYFVSTSYNFCWPVRTLRVEDGEDASDGSGVGGPCLVAQRMAYLSRETPLDHHLQVAVVLRLGVFLKAFVQGLGAQGAFEVRGGRGP
jgi:hypothetical protein